MGVWTVLSDISARHSGIAKLCGYSIQPEDPRICLRWGTEEWRLTGREDGGGSELVRALPCQTAIKCVAGEHGRGWWALNVSTKCRCCVW